MSAMHRGFPEDETPPAPAAPYRRWQPALLVLALVAGGFFFAWHTVGLAHSPPKNAISGFDQAHYFFWLRSACWRGAIDFESDIYECGMLERRGQAGAFMLDRTPIGHVRNKYGVGWAVASAPAFVLADATAHLWRSIDPASAPPEDGHGPIYQIFIFASQLILAAASLFLAARILRHWFAPGIAAVAVLVTWMGSFLFLYQTYHLGYAHSTVFFALTACYAAALRFAREPGAWWPWLLCGAAGGLLAITRYQTVVYLLYPVVLALRVLFAGRSAAAERGVSHPRFGGALGRIAAATAVFLLVASIQLFAWKQVYGSWVFDSYQDEPISLATAQWWNVLFSPFHGLFYWSPFLGVGAGGFFWWLLRRDSGGAWRRPELAWLISLLAIYVINASWREWWFGPAFGSRAFEGGVMFFMVGIAHLLRLAQASAWRHVGLTVAMVFIAGNFALAFAFVRTWIPRHAPVTYGQMWEGLIRQQAVARPE